MTIQAIQPAQGVHGPSAANVSPQATKAAGDYNAFLQLLVTQLKHQDPMKPLDPTQTVTQLAQFASVEQAVQTNALLAALGDMSSISQASGLIGRTVTSADGSIKGTVKSVSLSSGGLVATLTDGRTLRIGSGISIS